MVIGGVAGGEPPGVITPAQPERLRRDHGDLRVEVQQHHMITRSASGTRACSAKSSTAGRPSMEIRPSHSSAGIWCEDWSDSQLSRSSHGKPTANNSRFGT